MANYHTVSQVARTAFVEICALAGSTTVAEENAALSIGREHLPEHALKVLDKTDLSAREEREYYEWLTEGVQTAIDENAELAALEDMKMEKHYIVSAQHEAFGTEGRQLFCGTETEAQKAAERIARAGGHGWVPQFREAEESEIPAAV